MQAKLAWQWRILVKSLRDAAKIASTVRICPSDTSIAAAKFITLAAIFGSRQCGVLKVNRP
ncbi:MAG: hypothetical protein KAT26_09955 [Marinosulfonomonas sp.]|nr:hypothetical protein [Marinosulfonomonas sp.]